MHDLSIALKMARMRLKLSQKEIGEKIDYNFQWYSRIENDLDVFLKMPLYKFLKLSFLLDERFQEEILAKEFLKKLLTDYENNEYNGDTK